MKISIQADLEIDNENSKQIVEKFGSLDELKDIIFEILEARVAGQLSCGIDYKLKFVEPTPYEIKLALTESTD